MYACIYVPHFALQAIVRAEPALRLQPVAITEGTPPLCKVTDINQKACRAGIKLGMSKLEAAQLPGLTVRQRSPAQEAAAHAALLDLGFSFSPRVESTAPDTVVLDITGLEHLFGAPAMIARSLVERASVLGLKTQVGAAANIDAGVHAARGFRGITVIPEGQEAEILGSLPLEVMSAPPGSLETLERWGVRTFRALATLPTAQLSERLGQQGVRRQATVLGRTSRPLVPVEPALKFEEVMELEYPVTMLEPLAFILGRMLDQLCQRLEARALAANELRLKLQLENVARDLDCRLFDFGPDVDSGPDFGNASFPPTASLSSSRPKGAQPGGNYLLRTLRLPVPMRNSQLFLKLWLLHLKADPPQAPILKVTLAAAPAKPRVAQGGLFLPLAPDPEKLEVTLARIAGVVGKERVGSPEIEDTHRPDAFRMSGFDADASRIKSRKTRASSPESRLPRPQSSDSQLPGSQPRSLMALRIFRPPQPAVVEMKNGHPVRVYARRIRGEVVAASGPWRTSGNWWRNDAWGEDEWDIELQSLVHDPQFFEPAANGTATATAGTAVKLRKPGKRMKAGFYRIYQELASGNWFIRGMYD